MKTSLRVLTATAGAFIAVALGSAAASASTGPAGHYPVQVQDHHQVIPARGCTRPGYDAMRYYQPGPDRFRLFPYCSPQYRDPQPVRRLHREDAWESFTISQHGSSPYQPATAAGLLVSGPGYFTRSGRTETGHFDGATFTAVTTGGASGTFTVTGGTGRFGHLTGTGTYSSRPSGPRSRHSETITAEGTFTQLTYGGLPV